MTHSRLLFLTFLSIALLTACEVGKKVDRTNYDHLTIEELAKGDQLIDFSDSMLMGPIDINKLTNDDAKIAKAAVYRIYSNLELKDNQYLFRVKDAEKLHLSERVFDKYVKDIEEMNAHVRKEDEMEKLEPISSEYLNSLLK
ncbi:hypothetical protein [Sphingobacterium sp. CZ-2]|uniref:hypothetical protein n=1 Tax=Sphingobacterium sp. CZ-2 TaxID=2557994 RepID=UPI00106F364C|nr:hypothetical protein [Sphingobacterium sp. CZ-2]QBR12865.1 hypothetical protein E3D81_12110 [Sphingobacterium sp. CZ-2]